MDFPQMVSAFASWLRVTIGVARGAEGGSGDPDAVQSFLACVMDEYQRQSQESSQAPCSQEDAWQDQSQFQALSCAPSPSQVAFQDLFPASFQPTPQVLFQFLSQAPFQVPFQVWSRAEPSKPAPSYQIGEPAGSAGRVGGRPSDMRSPRGSCLVEGCPKYGVPQQPCQLRCWSLAPTTELDQMLTASRAVSIMKSTT